MSPDNERIRDEALELLLAVLASRDMERRPPVAETHDEIARNISCLWLVRHVDRWDEWGGLAWRQSAHALTQRLLALTTVTMVAEALVARGQIALPRPD